MDGQLLTKQEAREALRVGARKLDELVKRGDLEVIRLGVRTVRITESAMRDLLERRRQ